MYGNFWDSLYINVCVQLPDVHIVNASIGWNFAVELVAYKRCQRADLAMEVAMMKSST